MQATSLLFLLVVLSRGSLAQNVSSQDAAPSTAPPPAVETAALPPQSTTPAASTIAAAPPAPATTTAADNTCATDVQCVERKGRLYACVNSACVCGPAAYEKSGACLPYKNLTEACTAAEDCQHIDHAVCSSSVCSCEVGYTSDNNVCKLVIPPPTTTPAAVPMNRAMDGITIKPNYDPDGMYKVLKLKSSELVLECTVTGYSVNYTVTWLRNKTALPKDDRYKTVQPNKLIISKPEEKDADSYTCVFNFSNNATASQREDVVVIVPLFVRLPASTSAVEGEKLQLKCQVVGQPVPSIEWQFGNTSIKGDMGRYILQEFEGVPNAMLQIDDTKMEDRGEYSCIARNIYWNETSTTTMVRVKDKLAALWPFLGICAEVFVLCAIILIYEKKRNKTELEESDTDQSPEQKNTPDHGKDSVRQRK